MVTRRNLALAALLTVAITAVVVAKAHDAKFIKPSSFGRTVELLVSGKLRSYYLLDAMSQIEISVIGPSKLVVLSRAIIPQQETSVSYEYLVLREKTRKAVSLRHQTTISDQVTFAGENDGIVTHVRKKYIDVPKGEHKFSFYLPKGSTEKLAMRFAVETNAFTAGTPVVSMTPAQFTASADLVSKEETTTYYRIGTGYSVGLDVIGPATLKILSRIEFDANMSGKQKWRVRATEDGKVKGTYSLAAVKSAITAYRDPSSLVASKAETFYVEVPDGKHHYEFTLPENHRTVLLRFLLPKTQLERE